MLNEYKIFAGNMIVESDNTKELKMQLLNFVKDAAEPQVKNFILNGTIIESIKDSEIKIINEQFEKAYVQEGAVRSILGIIFAAPLWTAWRAIGAAMNDAKNKCGVFSIGAKRALCLAAAYKVQEQKRIAILTKAQASCKQAKNPDKCIQSIKAQIAKAQKKIQKYQLQVKKAAMKGKDVGSAEEKAKRTRGSVF
jgi:hypothetical protein